jgi:hypothetical protein
MVVLELATVASSEWHLPVAVGGAARRKTEPIKLHRPTFLSKLPAIVVIAWFARGSRVSMKTSTLSENE